MTADLLIRATNVGVTYAGTNHALRDITFSLRSGEFLTVVGPSGCGKTTLLRLIAGLLRPTTGALDVMEQPQHGKGRGVAFVFQEPTLLPWRTVEDNVRLPLELTGVTNEDQQRRVEECLRTVELHGDAHRYPAELSGGMRMRVSLARALVTRPRLVLLDEPFAALDDPLREYLGDQLLRLWQTERWGNVFVTHNIHEAVFLGGRVLVLSSKPGMIVREFPVPFPYPRSEALHTDTEFLRLVREVRGALRGTIR